MLRIACLVIFSVLGSYFVPGAEANRCQGQPDGTWINDYTSCPAFFTCVRNTPVPGVCPDGFHFNEAERKCDHPWNVVCIVCVEGGEQPTDPEDPPPEVRKSKREGPFFVPIEHECRKFGVCSGDVGFLAECAPGMMFDPVSRQCDVEANVNCQQSVCPNNINPNEPTFVHDPFDCSAYYICMNREPLLRDTCLGDLLFNRELRTCDLPENVECEVEGLPPSMYRCPATGLAFIPHLEDCSLYYICINGVQNETPTACAPGLQFDIETSSCRRPEEATCILDAITRKLTPYLL
ncbi:peritrophin-44-like [Uranotaenia lowii]|uniref:peritrophin-44-like n=1 Tax=Uranotaenia lowii TaxID=190385 RepID=UPI00247AB966|nr:peritrophin-44-like [Uranotaenia lowii]